MFDYLVETKREKGTKLKVLSFPVAVLLHVILIVMFVTYNIYSHETLEAPPIMVSFFSAPPPPPPPPPPQPAAASRKATPRNMPHHDFFIVVLQVFPPFSEKRGILFMAVSARHGEVTGRFPVPGVISRARSRPVS